MVKGDGALMAHGEVAAFAACEPQVPRCISMQLLALNSGNEQNPGARNYHVLTTVNLGQHWCEKHS